VGRRAPSAGFSQGLELLVLDTPETVAEFWDITRDPDDGWDPEDVAAGPTVIVLPLPDAQRYVARYSEPDKIAFGMDDEANWPVRFWDVDAAMASMLMLLAAVDARRARVARPVRRAAAAAADRDPGVRLPGRGRGAGRIVDDATPQAIGGADPPQRVVNS
jgi:hypothetical protein